MSSELQAQVRNRLARIAAPWTPTPPGPVEPPATPAGGRGMRLRLDRRALRALAVLLAVAVLATGWMWWQGRPRPIAEAPTVLATGVPLTSASTMPVASAEVVVHVAGAVRHPGLFHLPAGSRVADAVDAAGGARSERALGSVNLARLLVDGEQVLVGATSSTTGAEAGLNLNAADAAAFEALPGVGPVLAKRIVDWRTANGPFRSVDELGEVSGIGDSIMGQLRTLVHV